MRVFSSHMFRETGLDYHYNHSEPEVQRKAFIQQLKRAVELKKPIVIHSRAAEDDTYKILKEHVPKVAKEEATPI
jgi:TatD DNase family protein